MSEFRSRHAFRLPSGVAAWLRALAGASFFGGCSILLMLVFLRAFPPARPPAAIPPYDGYDPAPMDLAVAPAAVSNELKRILACGSRFEGQPGFFLAQDLVRKAFNDAGLEVHELAHRTLTPTTRRREVLDASGQPLVDVQVYPFMPNHFQPVTTGEAGVTGTLLLVDDEVLRNRPTFTDCIAVVDAENLPSNYGRNWIAYARAGFRAVLLAHRGGLACMRWEDVGGMRASTPVNFPRLAATEGIFEHLGETVTLHARVVWEEIDDVILVGRLPSVRASTEAVVITACTDAPSVLPDLAPGTLAAVNLAAQLALLQGIAAYRDDPNRKRDVLLVSHGSRAMALTAAEALTTVVGLATDREATRERLQSERTTNAARRKAVEGCIAALGNSGFLTDAERTADCLSALPPDVRGVFDAALRYAINSVLMELSEVQLEARLAFLRGGQDAASESFVAYRRAKAGYDDAMLAAGLPLRKLIAADSPTALARTAHLAARLAARLEELASHHDRTDRQLQQSLALHTLLRSYERLVVASPFLAPADRGRTAGESVTFLMGANVENLALRQAPVFNDVLQTTLQRGEFGNGFRYEPLHGRDHNAWAPSLIQQIPVDALHWNTKGHPAFAFINADRAYAYARFGSPIDEPFLRDVETLRDSLRMLGRTVLTLAYGYGTFQPPMKTSLTDYSGTVYAANVGASILPNHPLPRALVGHKGRSYSFEQNGYFARSFLVTDVYGHYERLQTSLPVPPEGMYGYSPEAAAFGPDGLIRYMKDEGPQGQQVYKSIQVGSWGNCRDINIVAFRATPVALFDVVNPQTMKPYTGVDFIRREGLAGLAKHNVFSSANDMVLAFLEPDSRFFVTLKAGSPSNEKIQTVRGFLLGVDEEFTPDASREIDGRGFLAADSGALLGMPRQAAASMQQVNGQRLALQVKHGMADERVRAFHERGQELLDRSLAPGLSQHAAERSQRATVTYATLNHPVLRRTVFEAVVGILWYLGLLVPFVFFFEKLAFGFTDIRRQLTAQAVIFLVVFGLLRWLHPAFGMIRSSLMILLGFVIMLVSGGITVLFSGKFKENLEELRKRQGHVAAADVNALGVLGTAFALGLNNMHRRIVRTGLTCATLVLLTFAMICFTSVQSDVVDVATAIGRAPYQGLLIKGDRFAPLSYAEEFALRERYEPKYTLAPRRMVVGHQGWDRINYNPDLEAVHEPTEGAPQRQPVSSILQFAPNEPLRDQIRLLAGPGWFTTDMVATELDVPPVLLADALAEALGVRSNDVAQGRARIKLNGKPVRVHGIFDSASLVRLRDMDGRDVLPFDIGAMRTVQVVNGQVLASDTDPRLDAGAMVITATGLGVAGSHGQDRLVSVAMRMDGLPYREAREEVDQYLEQSGQVAYYGLKGVAYRGKRARETSFAGLLELLIPLFIAAMTVLNTMRGSVYERRDEIFVYNAVGIAPRYIFAMFFSEAFVYAVVGSILGFVLSQGVGRLLTVLGWTGGLSMSFTSINTIYASLAIMVAVFLSTLFPARSAMAIAAPADDAGWNLPEPDGDDMGFALPFTFHARDRVAVLAFFRRFFADHGEGSSGRFFAAPPGLRAEKGRASDAAYLPLLETTVWLKPFDLGVSQQIVIAMPTDPETGEFLARVTLTRLSGTRESWLRLNPAFVTILRQRFLYWRAVGPVERAALFDEARTEMEASRG